MKTEINTKILYYSHQEQLEDSVTQQWVHTALAISQILFQARKSNHQRCICLFRYLLRLNT